MEKHDIGKTLFTIHRYFRLFLNYKLKNYELSSAEFLVLLVMIKKDGLSQESINKGLQFDKGFLAKVAKSLENKGYIIRKINQEDRRAYRLFLTDKAKTFIPEIFKILNEWDDTILEGMTKKEMEILNNALDKMLKRVVIKYKKAKEEL
ncbi:MarR family winged helix-turn-helix transcriptional regulator [Paramaledivibacter caminithermalis]|jgi:DNA-binding MarR family transcriptional regulator|uniref:HTH-type transcriptional regulator SarZ n=1 Tax=Paramaledivibacter caminithermalis (strain DSM 15212 / CIP 107654 / DViRD3) TaxID=1121301 RepID=A0A1M6RAR0_PARC5|nr:MarR family transcriptional regulator [Paramaledivibacter caminithermalis]SHK29554.1 DNA-binding transcriptional regulator, MarR family [Paramaledivibacter caminithermalis DSM 15212]